MTKNYYVYVLQCADNTLYCGYTDDVKKRVATHNSGKGAKYTKPRLPVKLLTSIEFDNKSEATKCEWWFKHTLNRKQKLTLIKNKQLKTAFLNNQNSRQN
ncbi:GIY-YIG nuclease family protein [Lactococcus protaetiae]|uniref:GIY-YIG nuclease family protein n=1 Tax=Lactococcus protaetiae TaxID=2592653 RepID=A0A514ZB33_9LACT|nr:GIY-YIG nuclease family protein [Lactococcus protaetiae]MCL2113772.1 GIY-YIG nuclease family protein [Streptococcaceae bacterium]QDK71790.1 GIY-YIG nuclease family protein [Lactococcus protaetiae]